MGVKVPLSEFGAALGRVMAEKKKAAERGLYAAALRAVSEIQTTIIPSKIPQPVDRGIYRAGWRAERLSDGGALVVNREPHAAMIEYGVRASNVKPGRAMISALAAWSVRKGLANDLEQGQRVAWAIALRLQQTGIFAGGRGFGILKDAKAKLPQWIREEVTREMNRSRK